MRYYHVGVAALVANADEKWVDNLLSHFTLPGVESARRGVSRKISASGLEHIALVRRLASELGIPLARAAELAIRLLSDTQACAEVAPMVLISLDRATFRTEVADIVADAAETTAPARRGRKPARTRGE